MLLAGDQLRAFRHGTLQLGGPTVMSGCRFCDSSSRGMLDGLIDPSRIELESALSSMGSIGMGLKLRLKYHAAGPAQRGPGTLFLGYISSFGLSRA